MLYEIVACKIEQESVNHPLCCQFQLSTQVFHNHLRWLLERRGWESHKVILKATAIGGFFLSICLPSMRNQQHDWCRQGVQGNGRNSHSWTEMQWLMVIPVMLELMMCFHDLYR